MNSISRRRFCNHSLRFVLGGAALGCPWPHRLQSAEKADPNPAFEPLWNGRNFDGWVPVNVAPKTFSIRDGMIVSTGIPTGVMRTTRHYENFILELEWRHMKPEGNAGLFVYAEPLTAPGVPFAKAIEVQILDGDSPEGVWTGHGDLFSIHGARMKPDRPHPRGWERCLPSERRAHPAGEWNHYRVESRAGRLTLAVNGKVVSGASECRPRKGYICLESEGSECHFRNLRICELPTSNPPSDEVAGIATGFQTLYTGLDLAGWNGTPEHAGHWTSKDWILDCDGQGPKLLQTQAQWANAEFIVDWRPVSDGMASLLPRGDTNAAVKLAGEKGRWNRTILTVKGQQITVRVNDGAAEERPIASLPDRGPLALQHNGKPVQFANLYARPLD